MGRKQEKNIKSDEKKIEKRTLFLELPKIKGTHTAECGSAVPKADTGKSQSWVMDLKAEWEFGALQCHPPPARENRGSSPAVTQPESRESIWAGAKDPSGAGGREKPRAVLGKVGLGRAEGQGLAEEQQKSQEKAQTPLGWLLRDHGCPVESRAGLLPVHFVQRGKNRALLVQIPALDTLGWLRAP